MNTTVLKNFGLEHTVKDIDGMPFYMCPINVNNNSTIQYYLSLETRDGNYCIGHWIFECAIFLPFFSILQNDYPNIKILLSAEKKFKKQFIKECNIDLNKISYNSILIPANISGLYERLTIPNENNSIVIIPNYKYVELMSLEDKSNINLWDNFVKFLNIDSNPMKTIDTIYLIRSINTSENFNIHTRRFHNLNDVVNLIKNKNIPIIDVSKIDNIRDQIKLVQSAKNIIVEGGSAYTINGLLIARNSNIIVLNWLIHGSDCQSVIKLIANNNNNRVEPFPSLQSYCDITIDIDALDKCLLSL